MITLFTHYTKANTAIDKIFNSGMLKFGNFKEVNDPRESKTWPFKFYCLKADAKPYFEMDFFNQVHDFIASRASVLCFTLNNSIVDSQEVNAELQEGWSNHRMWAHYGDNHKGLCLVFNRDTIDSKIKATHSSKMIFADSITYTNSNMYDMSNREDPYMLQFEAFLSQGISSYMNNHVSRFSKELFFLKHYLWRDEKEFRYVIFSDNEDEEYYVEMDGALEAIILGEDFEERYLEDIMSISESFGVDIYRMYTRGWAVHLFKIDREDVSGVSLQGISYPTHFYYELLYAQACSTDRKRKTILFDFLDNGAVKILE